MFNNGQALADDFVFNSVLYSPHLLPLWGRKCISSSRFICFAFEECIKDNSFAFRVRGK